MTSPNTLSAELSGYDRGILLSLRPEERNALNSLGHFWLGSAVLLSAPLMYAAWLLEKNPLLCAFIGIFSGLMVQNLTRLITAGGGVAPDLPPPRDYRPSLLPTGILLCLSLVVAQPAGLLLPDAAADRQVQAHRVEILQLHRKSQQASNALVSQDAPSERAFRRSIADCEFLLLRLSLLWNHPERAVITSGVFSLLVLLPIFLGRGAFIRALQAYERRRYVLAGSVILALEQEGRRRVAQELSRYSTYRPTPHGGLLKDAAWGIAAKANTPQKTRGLEK